jgi:hypothetical protein
VLPDPLRTGGHHCRAGKHALAALGKWPGLVDFFFFFCNTDMSYRFYEVKRGVWICDKGMEREVRCKHVK